MPGRHRRAGSLLAHFVHERPELVDVLEAPVHAREADVGDLVELLEFAHHQFADAAGQHLALPEVEQLFLDALDGAVDLRGAHRPLAQRDAERADELAAVVFDAPAVLLHHVGEADFRALIGREALVAGPALPAPPHEVPVLGHARFDDLRLGVAAERALHCRGGGLGAALRSAIDREAARERVHLLAHRGQVGFVVRVVQHIGHQVRGDARFLFLEAARRDRGRAHPDAARHHRLFRIVRDGVLVDGDMGLAQGRFGRLAGDALGAQVHQHDVAFGAAADDAQAALDQRLGEHLGVLRDLLLVGLEFGRQRFLEGHCLGGDDVLQRAALQAREDGGIDRLLVFGLHEDDAAARAAQALVRRGGDHIGEGHGVRVFARDHQAGIVGDVHPEDRADFLGDLREAFEIDAQGIGGCTGDDQLGLVLAGLGFQRVVVDFFLLVQAVRHDVEPLAAHVERHAVRQVAAFGQAHAQDGVAGLQEGEQHGLVGLRAGIGLHVGGFGAEELLHAVDGQLLDHVHVLAAAVVALAGIAFCVLVGELRALGRHDGGRGVVLAGDQFDVLLLAQVLGLDGGPHFGIGLFDKNIALVHGVAVL